MMKRKYKKEIEEIKSQDWIHKVYEEKLQGLVGYFIQFIDGSFIIGNIKKTRFEYTFVKNIAYIGDGSHSELFVNFVDVCFDGQLARASFMEALHKEFNPKVDKPIEKMSKAEIEAEMLMAAKYEDFERAAVLKKKLEEK